MSINNTPETRAFLSVLEAMDGPATMADIRKRTSLNEDKRHYQFKKLEKAGIISVEYNEWGGTSTAPMKEAQLTESGQELLESGFLDEETSEFERANVDIVELAEEVRTYNEFLKNSVYEDVKTLTERVEQLEEQIAK
jgi:DNA-binding PadR family transcriptional regulator